LKFLFDDKIPLKKIQVGRHQTEFFDGLRKDFKQKNPVNLLQNCIW